MYYVYILTNYFGASLYTGVTNDIARRLDEHKRKLTGGFTARYNINRLIYLEATESVKAAIVREKQIKSWPRARKIALIKEQNPRWQDLSEEWSEGDGARIV